MSNLTNSDKLYLEKILGMKSGYVLDFTDASFGDFFSRFKIKIHNDPRYQLHGTSKAKKMRAFWDLEHDGVVASVLNEMLDVYEAECELKKLEIDNDLLQRCRKIVIRIGGNSIKSDSESSMESFLNNKLEIPNLKNLPIQLEVAKIIEKRLKEAQNAMKVEAYLSVILMSGSSLEGVLLGVAQNKPELFNRASCSPKTQDNKVKPLQNWTLANLIDTACEVGLLQPDVKKFSHGLRDFRNYIHPYQQMVSKFTPDKHTAEICYQVLIAALADLSGERKNVN